MTYKNFVILIALFPLITAYRVYKDMEIEIILEIFKELNIGHCILVVENLQSMILIHKGIYDDNRFFAHIQKEDLKFFLDNAESVYMRIGFVINIDVIDAVKDFFEIAPSRVSRFTWLIFASETVGNKFTIPYNCDFLTVESLSENEYLIKGIYYVKSNGPFFADFGVWSNKSGLTVNDKFYDEKRNMRGVMLIRGDSTGIKICNGNITIIDTKHRAMWVENAYLMNYSMVIVDGHLDGDGKDPMAPDGSPCSIAQTSLHYIPDTVFPTCLMPTSIVVKFENDVGEGWKAYFKPFDDELWWSVLGFLTISIVIFMIIGYFTNSIFYINPFSVFYSFCDQDGIDLNNEKLTSLSSLIAYLMPFVAATVIVPAYSAAILAKLTVQLPKVPFTDLESFVRVGTYKLGALNNTFSLRYFSESKDPLVIHIYQNMFLNPKDYPNNYRDAAYKLCRDKNFAFLAYGGLRYVTSFPSCKLFQIQNFVLNLYCGFRMRLGSPFKSIFNKLLITFYERGLLERLQGFPTIKGKMKPDETFEPIEMSQVTAILYLVLIGIVLSFAIVIIEILKRKKNKKDEGDGVLAKRNDKLVF